MGTLEALIESLSGLHVQLEAWDRRGQKVRELDGPDAWRAVRFYREVLAPLRHGERQRIGLVFRSEETIEFLVMAFAAISRGFTVVPLYPNWDADTQELYLRRYGIDLIAVGEGFRDRAEGWSRHVPNLVHVSLDDPRLAGLVSEESDARLFPDGLDTGHPVAWIFTSGTSSEFAKCTEISLGNIEAAIENIRSLEFLWSGMSVHCPLSASHIFAFVVIMGFLALKPRRVLFSDVQHLARLPQERIGKIDAMILVPIVLNRMRSGFYEKLASDLSGDVPPELQGLARIPRPVRRALKRLTRRAELGFIALEQGRLSGRLALPAIHAVRRVFGRLFQRRLGSPEFVVIGGAKPSLESMALLEVMGVRVLQGWGMTETTGPLCVCDPRDRRSGAFGTCGDLFTNARAVVEDEEELVVEGPQIANGYVEPDGTLVPFDGRKRTGDRASFDGRSRLRVHGKVSDRITTDNGLNYFPVPMEERLKAIDADRESLLEEVVVIGDGKPRLGCVLFLREGAAVDACTDEYCERLVRDYNATRPVDEKIGPRSVSPQSLREVGGIGPTGKLVRRVIEARFASIYGDVLV